jgi:hypothetical protein
MRLLTSDYSSLGTGGRYQIDTDRKLWIEEYHGKTELDDVKSVMSSLMSDPAWSSGYHGVIDFTDAELDLSANDILRLALVLRHDPNRSRGWLAYVAPSSTSYGVVRMLGYWSRATERLKIFQTRAEAEDWLEVHQDQKPACFMEEEAGDAAGRYRNVG